jgi:hypothetical protein
LFLTSTAFASSIPVANFSFETNNGFNNSCGGSCQYSTGIPIPSWNITGFTGQWITGGFAGNPNAFDGSVLAYTNGGTISQDVGSAVAGDTYTLQVEVLHRTDLPLTGVVQLEVGGGVVATATGTDSGPGTWNNFTAVYTATAADAGKTLTILLSANSGQGDFDFVRLDSTSAVPEPMTLFLLGSGLGLTAWKIRPKRS